MSEQILDLVERWAQAELRGDVDAYDQLLTDDFVGAGPVGFTLTKPQWAGRHRHRLHNEEFEVLEPQVRIYGDVAVVNGIQKQRTIAMGRDASGSFRLTLVAVRDHDRWAIANLQLSGPLRPTDAPSPFPRAEASTDEPTIARADLQRAIADGTVTVVDALPENAYQHRHLPTAVNLTAEDAPAMADTVLPERSRLIVAYSTDAACTRGPDLVATLIRIGYQRVRLYSGGIEDWVSAGLPIETHDA